MYRTGQIGIAEEDILKFKSLREEEDYFVKLDYMANSVGVILVEKAEIGKIVLTPSPGIISHRINKGTITIHYSDDNFEYYEVPKDDYNLEKDEEGRVTITFKETIPAVAFKVHSNYDDRDLYNEYVDLSTFKNNINQIIRIYQRADEGKIEYQYDAGGNRTERHTIVGNDDTTEYEYYEDSNRLKKASYSISGETYKERYYIYDENGNLTAKGNEVTENGDGSLSLVKDTVSSRYWEYEYSADNRLEKAYYKGELKAEYSYDADGKRITSYTVDEGTTYFIFSYTGKVLLEESASSDGKNKLTSYVYALNKQIARVEGVIGGEGELICYHYDNLGSTRLMTDEGGEIVFDQDYLPFGGDLAVVGDIEPKNDVGEGYKYTGQREEVSIGLYYYGARFYDSELGRFITEDTYVGVLANPQSQNVYIYVLNNPMRYVDPSGHVSEEPDFDQDLDLNPPEYDISLGDYSLELPNNYDSNNWLFNEDFTYLKIAKDLGTDIPGVNYQQMNYYNMVKGYIEMTSDIYTNKIGNRVEINTMYNEINKQTLVEKNTMAMQWYSISGNKFEEIKYESERQRNLIGVEGFVTGATYYRALMVGVTQQGIVGEWQGNTLPNNSTDYGIIAETKYGKPYRMTRGKHKNSYDAIWLENDAIIPTINKNPNQGGKRIADYIHIHSGWHDKWRGSAGCPTIRPFTKNSNGYPNGSNWLNFQKNMVNNYNNGDFIGNFYLKRLY